jgi:sterol desaturase/sphingolipid hydroxylase (fatty acid hydroxylase superfamily)
MPDKSPRFVNQRWVWITLGTLPLYAAFTFFTWIIVGQGIVGLVAAILLGLALLSQIVNHLGVAFGFWHFTPITKSNSTSLAHAEKEINN